MLIICGIMMLILGLVMVINPKISTKEEFRNDSKIVMKTKKNGFILIGCGIALFILVILSK